MKILIKKLFDNRKVRFLFVGALNTIVGYGVYAACIYAGLHYFLAQFIASVMGITHSYLWNKFFTFRVRKKSVSEVFRFVAVYGAAYLVNVLLLWVLIDEMHLDMYFAGLICTAFTVVISYIGHKKISFRKK